MTSGKIPLIRLALGDDWDKLHPTVRRHYDLAPTEDQMIVVSGTMATIDHNRIAGVFLLIGRLFGALVPYRGVDVPTTVRNWTAKAAGGDLFWQRSFEFPGGRTVQFSSRMSHLGGGDIIEYVRLGLGIRLHVSVEDGSLIFRSRGYQWDIGPWSLRLPGWLFLGDGEITETGLSAHSFGMSFQMRHPLFGRTFVYNGQFEIPVSDRTDPAS